MAHMPSHIVGLTCPDSCQVYSSHAGTNVLAESFSVLAKIYILKVG